MFPGIIAKLFSGILQENVIKFKRKKGIYTKWKLIF
uniref:Uncharacterized protein n=1 Tax=Eubacterium plexicaudatum ASF492 TaxID=1235802 RepID=N1ZW59_9FIRM